MFFVFSKILAFLLKPINWIFFSLLLGRFLKRQKLKVRSLNWAILLLLFFSNKFIFTKVLWLWEVQTITSDQIDAPYDIGILLGGYSAPEILPNQDRHNFNSRANRFNNTLELYARGKIKKILVTGGTGSLLQNFPKEAEGIQKYLVQLGVPEADIIVEAASKNTRENALFTAKILEEQYPEAKCLLITSAWHMRRAIGCFKKAGLSPTPYSVDFMNEITRPSIGFFLLPSAYTLENWEYIIREWFGYLMYRIAGYI